MHKSQHDQHCHAGVDSQEHWNAPQEDNYAAEDIDRRRPIRVGQRAPAGCGEDSMADAISKAVSETGLAAILLRLRYDSYERDRNRVAGGLGEAQAESAQHVPPVVARTSTNGFLGDAALFPEFLELRRFIDLQTIKIADHDQDRAEQEGTATPTGTQLAR
jgi:hypothetical protein